MAMLSALFLTGCTLLQAAPADAWWSSDYEHRTRLELGVPVGGLESGYSVRTSLDHAAWLAAGQALADGRDVRVVRWANGGWQELPRVLDSGSSWGSAATQLWFRVPDALAADSDDFYVYFGNTLADPAPEDPRQVFLFADDFESGALSNWTPQPAGGLWEVATDQAHRGTRALKYPPQAFTQLFDLVPNPSVAATDVVLESWWRVANTTTDVGQLVRVNGANHYGTNCEGTSGWNITRTAGTFTEVSTNTGTPQANTWTRVSLAIAGTRVRVLVGGTQLNPGSGTVDVGNALPSGNIALHKFSVAGGWWVDDVVVRRYRDPEPTLVATPPETCPSSICSSGAPPTNPGGSSGEPSSPEVPSTPPAEPDGAPTGQPDPAEALRLRLGCGVADAAPLLLPFAPMVLGARRRRRTRG